MVMINRDIIMRSTNNIGRIEYSRDGINWYNSYMATFSKEELNIIWGSDNVELLEKNRLSIIKDRKFNNENVVENVVKNVVENVDENVDENSVDSWYIGDENE